MLFCRSLLHLSQENNVLVSEVYGKSFSYVHLGFFWAPYGTRLTARCHFTGPKKVSISRAQPPPACPRNGSARIKNITYGAV
jgi:hypothetical protein